MKKTFVESHLNKISVPKAKAARKPKADSKLDNTIIKTPIRKAGKNAENLAGPSNFMRTTAFTMQSKIRSAISQIRRVDSPAKIPLASFNSPASALQPHSSSSWLSKPINRFKLGFVLSVVCSIGAYAVFSEELGRDLSESTKVVSSWFGDKDFVPGMMQQTNGIPSENDKSGTLLPLKDSAAAPVEMVSDKVKVGADTNALPVEAPAAPAVKSANQISPAPASVAEESKSASPNLSKKTKPAKKNKKIKQKKVSNVKNKSKGVVVK